MKSTEEEISIKQSWELLMQHKEEVAKLSLKSQILLKEVLPMLPQEKREAYLKMTLERCKEKMKVEPETEYINEFHKEWMER